MPFVVFAAMHNDSNLGCTTSHKMLTHKFWKALAACKVKLIYMYISHQWRIKHQTISCHLFKSIKLSCYQANCAG